MINYLITFSIISTNLLSGVIFSQVYYFNNRYDLNAPEIWDGGTNIIEYDDCYIMCGTTGDVDNYYWHRLGYLKVNKQGAKIWNKTLGDENAEYYFGNPGSMLVSCQYSNFG